MKLNLICKNVVAVGCLAASLTLAPSVYADASKKDMKIIGKALSFIEGGPSGDVAVDIIYDPGNAASVSDAEAVVKLLSGGLKSGKITLTGNKKTEESTGAPVAYIAQGSEGKAGSLSDKGIITVSTNPECAISSKCVLGVATSPKVAIHVNVSASSNAGASFGSAFRMMITEH